MEEQPNTGNGRPDGMLSDEERRERMQSALWWSAATIWDWRRFIVLTTGAVAILAVVITLLMPNWYRAEARVLLPEAGSRAGFAAMLGDLSPLASSLLGGPRGDYVRYLAILESRRVKQRVVEEFDLETVYKTSGREDSMERAMRALAGNTDFTLDRKLDYLAVSVLDKDRQRAADMANFFVSELNRVNTELSVQNASTYRRFVEDRYNRTLAELDSARSAHQQFQERFGVIELPKQAEAFMESVADLRANALQAEIRANALAQQYGPDNPQVLAARNTAVSANRELQRLYAGSDRLMPIAFQNLPALARQYTEVMQEVMIQQEILRFVRPLYEQALFDEQRESLAVQVLDEAVPPVRKATPKRMIIVFLTTLSAFLLLTLFALAYARWHAGLGGLLPYHNERVSSVSDPISVR